MYEKNFQLTRANKIDSEVIIFSNNSIGGIHCAVKCKTCSAKR